MQSTNLEEIKAALWDQAFIGRTWVSCPMGRVVGIRRRKGQLLAMIYGWGRWYPVEHLLIVAARFRYNSKQINLLCTISRERTSEKRHSSRSFFQHCRLSLTLLE